MKIVLAQFSPARKDRAASRDRVASLLAAAEGDWFVLPEMALSGFTMDLEESSWDRGDFDFFSALAREKRAYITVGGVKDRRNCAFTFDRGGALFSIYEKRHLFSISDEDKSYRAGTGFEGFDLVSSGESLRVGPAICYDLRFPYHFWKQAQEADIYFVIAAWPRARRDHWRTLLAARAIENQAFVVGVNRTGYPPLPPGVPSQEADYAGTSLLIDPRGRVLLDCGETEGAYAAEIDPAEVASWRTRFGAMADRLE